MGSVIGISLIGAGLVIIGLMILWLLMALLVRLTESKSKSPVPAEPAAGEDNPASSEQLHKGIAAATAAAFLLSKSTSTSTKKKKADGLTAWQSMHKHTQLYGRYRNLQINRIKK